MSALDDLKIRTAGGEETPLESVVINSKSERAAADLATLRERVASLEAELEIARTWKSLALEAERRMGALEAKLKAVRCDGGEPGA